MTEKRPTIIGVYGKAGVGKTLLINKVAKVLEEQYAIATVTDGIFTLSNVTCDLCQTQKIDKFTQEQTNLLSDLVEIIFVEIPANGWDKFDLKISVLDAREREIAPVAEDELVLLNKIDLATIMELNLVDLKKKFELNTQAKNILLTDIKNGQGLHNIVYRIQKTVNKLQKEAN